MINVKGASARISAHLHVIIHRYAMAMFMVTVAASMASAQRGANFASRDVPALVEKSLLLAANDTVLVGTGRGKVGVDVDLSISIFRSAARMHLSGEVSMPKVEHPRLTRTAFYTAWDCPQRAVTVECKLKSAGEFLTIYAVEPSASGDEISVWISFTSKGSAPFERVRIVARAYKFSRDSSGTWRFLGAGGYLVS